MKRKEQEWCNAKMAIPHLCLARQHTSEYLAFNGLLFCLEVTNFMILRPILHESHLSKHIITVLSRGYNRELTLVTAGGGMCPGNMGCCPRLEGGGKRKGDIRP